MSELTKFSNHLACYNTVIFQPLPRKVCANLNLDCVYYHLQSPGVRGHVNPVSLPDLSLLHLNVPSNLFFHAVHVRSVLQ